MKLSPVIMRRSRTTSEELVGGRRVDVEEKGREGERDGGGDGDGRIGGGRRVGRGGGRVEGARIECRSNCGE